METHEAIKEAIGPYIKEVAKRLVLSRSTVYKWTEPAEHPDDSGELNPLDRLDAIVDEAKRRGRGEAALAPLYWLCHEHGLTCFKLPPAGEHDAVGVELVRVIKEFSDLAQATSEALADNRINIPDRKRIVREGYEAIRAITTLIHVVRESVT